jgi:selenocysteine-specific elongation factor
MRHVILGTAGHIDHGKSTLVKALTGIDPDRLKEEKERGITIDLGFADLTYPDGLTVGIVDVPGHERLVKNMLAGAGGIDLVLLVIAADEGIMPQSREHLHICNLLRIKTGLVAITKSDLVEEEWLDLVKDEVKVFVKGTFLEGAEVVPVSARSLHNIDVLKEKIRDVALKADPKPVKGLFRLPIDRVFTLKGFGTVVTGTAISGSISVDDIAEILPSGIKTKVRGLHSHGKPIKTAVAGQRVAINLQGIDKEELNRGDSIVLPERFVPTRKIDATVELLSDAPPVKTKSLIHFHLGTAETIGRIILYGIAELKAGETCFCQLRLREPVIAMGGDRFIIRRFSPVETIGGGEVLDPLSYRRTRKEGFEDLEVFQGGTLPEKIGAKVKRAGIRGIQLSLIEGWIREELPSIREAVKSLKEKGVVIQLEDVLIHEKPLSDFREGIKRVMEEFHRQNPLKPGMLKEELRAKFNLEPRLFADLISLVKSVVIEKELVRLASFRAALSGVDESAKSKVLQLLQQGEFQPPFKEELAQSLKLDTRHLTDILNLMTKEGSLIRITEAVYIPVSVHDEMIARLKKFFAGKPEMTVAEFRDVLGTSRKYALPFLEYLDAQRMTMRVGDVRKSLLK